VKCFQRAGFHDQEEDDEESKEDTGLAEVICSLPQEIQNDVVSVDGMESADADRTVHEDVPTTPEDILEDIFQEMEQPPLNEELYCENDSDDDNDTVSDEHVRLTRTHKAAPQCVSQIRLFSPPISAHG
jgi:hypothetical protein